MTVIDGYRMYPIRARIRNNATGEIRELDDELLRETSTHEWQTYIWSDGNYSCDCNRRLFFARAKDEPEDWESTCSDGKFSVNLVDAKTSKIIYREFEEAANK